MWSTSRASKDLAASLAQHRKGTLALRLRDDRGEFVPIHSEVLIVPDLGASMFSVG